MVELVLSLFPGIDLLGRGFEDEGYAVVRGPDLIFGGDVRKFHPEKQRPRSFRSQAYFREACRLQGLPDDFELPGFTVQAAIKAVGNGVALPLARTIARAVKEATT